VGSTVQVNVVFNNSTKLSSKTLTVVNAAYLNELTLGDITSDSSTYASARLTAANLKAANAAGKPYYIPIASAKDQYGNTLSVDDLNRLVANKSIYVTSGSTSASLIGSLTSGTSSIFSKNEAGNTVIKITGDGTTAGAGLINILSMGGATKAASFTVLENEKIDKLAITPEEELWATANTALDITAVNQYGEDVDLYKSVITPATPNNTLVFDGKTTVTATVTGGTGSIVLTPTKSAATKKVTFTITPSAGVTNLSLSYTTASGKADVANYKVATAATADAIKGLASTVATTITNGNKVNLATAGNVLFVNTAGKTVSTGATFSASPAAHVYTVAAKENTTPTVTKLESGIITAIKDVTESTTDTYTITLYDKDSKVIDTLDVPVTVVPTDNLKYSVSADGLLYTGVADATTKAKYLTLKLTATDANGKAATVSSDLIKSVSVSPNSVAYAASDATDSANVYPARLYTKAIINSADAIGEKTGTANVTIATATGTQTIPCTFKYSSDASKATAAVLTKVKTETTAEATVTDNTIAVKSASKADALAGYTFVINDQYGYAMDAATVNPNTDSLKTTYTITNYTRSDKTTVNNVTALYSAGQLVLSGVTMAAGDTFNVTASNSGVTRTVSVTADSIAAGSAATATTLKVYEGTTDKTASGQSVTANDISIAKGASISDALNGYTFVILDQNGYPMSGDVSIVVSNYKALGNESGNVTVADGSNYTNGKLVLGALKKGTETYKFAATDTYTVTATVGAVPTATATISVTVTA
jgi:hypothetical protein